MTNRSRNPRPLLASTLALTIPLAGCFGPSTDKGDNGDVKIFTPKPTTVEDANTAGDRKTVLPVPNKPEIKPADSEIKPAESPAAKPDEAPLAKPTEPEPK